MAKITWFGHSAIKIEIAGKTLVIDPMLNQNPASPIKSSEIKKADAVYVTHDHPDHLGEAFDICKRTGAVFVSVVELANFAQQEGVKNAIRMNVGGSWALDDVKLNIVQAIHSATRGTPTGVVIQGEGLSIYDSGDTALFGDMRLIGDHYSIDLACISMGGVFTMDAKRAVESLSLLRPKMVLPIHYRTFPNLAKDINEFEKMSRSKFPDVKVLRLNPGDSYELAPRV